MSDRNPVVGGASPGAPQVVENNRGRGSGLLDWRLGGVLLGLLSTLAVGLQGPLGVSTAYVSTEAVIAEKLAPGSTASNAYFTQVGAALTPEWMVVIGMILGGVLASFIWRSRVRGDSLPLVWRERFGTRTLLRFAATFAGGVLILFGARLAGGCTSGHAISGMSQLALSGLVFTTAIFGAGIPVALVLYSRRNA